MCGNSKFSLFFIQILFLTSDDSSADVLCIVFHEQNFRKMKLHYSIKVFKFSIEKVWKIVLENVSEPCINKIEFCFEA